MGLQYKAAVLHAPKTPLVIETIEADEFKVDDVLVRIKAVGLCHTDLEVIEGAGPHGSRRTEPVIGPRYARTRWRSSP